MEQINQVLMGWIQKGLELRYTPQGTAVATFNISLPAGKVKDAEGVEKSLYTYVRVSAWKELGEDINENYKEGELVKVSGILKSGKPYESKVSKEMKSSLEFTAFKIEHVK